MSDNGPLVSQPSSQKPTSEEPQEQDQEEPQVEITGLELLMFSDEMDTVDYSFDSYAQDSFGVIHERIERTNATKNHHVDAVQQQEEQEEVLSNASSSVCDSFAADDEPQEEEVDYGYGEQYVPPRCIAPIRYFSSGPQDAGDDVSSDVSLDLVDYGRYKSTRRSSMGSYANDSINDFDQYNYYNSSRRSSLGSCSYANDSVYKAKKTSVRKNTGATPVPSRRASLGSYANDSLNLNLQHLAKMKRRCSNESFYAFSKEVYETQSINTNGVGRAA